MPDVKQFHKKLVEKYGDLEVWEIDGEKLRAEKDIEFTNFGLWPDFDYIPKNELWLDVERDPAERRFFIDHMLAQWKTLKKKIGRKNGTLKKQKKQNRHT